MLKKEAIDYLFTRPDGIYIDGTIGGGGHAAEIVQRLISGGKLIAFDKDNEAIYNCKKRFADELAKGRESRIVLYNKSYDYACSIKRLNYKVCGILLDLGVSSKQIDNAEKGFSYRFDGKLDMRFGYEGLTAETLLNKSSEEELVRLFRAFGEEPRSKLIARRIVYMRRAVPITTTFQLKEIISQCVPQKHLKKTLSRIFQAIRIQVNNELEILQSTLYCIIPMMSAGGRIVVISYHSLEDRIVKNTFKRFSGKIKTEDNTSKTLRILTPKPIRPSTEEITKNQRSRSAKMRVAEKI